MSLCTSISYTAQIPVKVGTFLQETTTFYDISDGLRSNSIHRILPNPEGGIFAQSEDGWEQFQGELWTSSEAPTLLLAHGLLPTRLHSKKLTVHQAVQLGDGRWAAATSNGLQIERDEKLSPWIVEDGKGREWGRSDVRGITLDTQGQVWFGTLAGAACLTKDGWVFYEGKDGLPYSDFTCLTAGPNGEVWFGTHLGLVRFANDQWSYRQGRRWIPSDDIRDLKVDPMGSLWVATSNGVGVIHRQGMTLAEKASFYEHEIETQIKRTPFGYVSEVSLSSPGDKSNVHYHDSDNDGLWTSMYGAAECFAYGATKNPAAKRRATQAFEALRFLQKVTQGGSHPAPKGFVARTIRSTSHPDPNEGRLERDREMQKKRDSLWKIYEPRWPKSADGKWFWKSDTSSDELDGHYFFYPLYYDLVATTAAEKRRVQEVVIDLTDHIIQHGYNLVDHTETVTRWGVYSPEALNHDYSWWEERGLKSLSLLSYLAVAAHVTGEARYLDHQEQLVREHGYDTNAMIYKIHRGIGTGNQSDDEMAFMSYYNLLRYTPKSSLRNKMLLSFYAAWRNEAPELNPFFHFAFGAHAMGEKATNPWGRYSIEPHSDWLTDSIETLKGFPLDRLNWSSKNSHRLDIVPLPAQNVSDILGEPNPNHGYRVNGKVLPIENRHFNHWNTNPWELDYGGNGTVLASGTVFLLPYYMGLYHGFIQ
ncbi:hypothetical protein OAK97_00045 [bacterium]|nr:hypothetical protein [bacterium]